MSYPFYQPAARGYMSEHQQRSVASYPAFQTSNHHPFAHGSLHQTWTKYIQTQPARIQTQPAHIQIQPAHIRIHSAYVQTQQPNGVRVGGPAPAKKGTKVMNPKAQTFRPTNFVETPKLPAFDRAFLYYRDFVPQLQDWADKLLEKDHTEISRFERGYLDFCCERFADYGKYMVHFICTAEECQAFEGFEVWERDTINELMIMIHKLNWAQLMFIQHIEHGIAESKAKAEAEAKAKGVTSVKVKVKSKAKTEQKPEVKSKAEAKADVKTEIETAATKDIGKHALD